MKSFIQWIVAFVTLKPWRQARRRRRYEELKALIVKYHLAGKGGMVVPKKFDAVDLQGFRSPMYAHARTKEKQRCLFWRKELMTEEVGPPLQAQHLPEPIGGEDECH